MTSMLDKLLKKEIKSSMTVDDIKMACYGWVPVCIDNDLTKSKDFWLKELLTKGCLIILVLPEGEKSGHFICLIYHKEKFLISFFDGYGINPEELRSVHLLDFLGTLSRYYGIEYNRVKHQRLSAQVNNCGDYCIVRCMNKHMVNSDFNKLLVKKFNITSSDQLIVMMTASYFMGKENFMQNL